MFAALSTRLWFLQVLATEVYAQEAQNNSVRIAKTDALRGEIWTRTSSRRSRPARRRPRAGHNRKSLEVRVNKQELIESGRGRAVLLRLSEMLDVPVEDIVDKLADKRYFAYQPCRSPSSSTKTCASTSQEHPKMFPGVEVVDATSVRAYPMGRLAAHVLGYGGQIDADQVKRQPPIAGLRPQRHRRQDRRGARLREVSARRAGGRRYVVERRRRDDPRTWAGRPHARRRPGPHARPDVQQSRRGAPCRRDGARPHDLRRRPHQQVLRGATPAPSSCSMRRRAASWPWPPTPATTLAGSSEGLKPQETSTCSNEPSCAARSTGPSSRSTRRGRPSSPSRRSRRSRRASPRWIGYYAAPRSTSVPADTSGTPFSNWSRVDLRFMSIADAPDGLVRHVVLRVGLGLLDRSTSNNQLGRNNEPLQRDLRRVGLPAARPASTSRRSGGAHPRRRWNDAPAQKDPSLPVRLGARRRHPA